MTQPPREIIIKNHNSMGIGVYVSIGAGIEFILLVYICVYGTE